jgi:CP family cyanate transporter-like MFS transporter
MSIVWHRSARTVDPTLVVILAGVSAALHVGKLSPALPVLREALSVTLLQAGFLLSLVQFAGMTLGLAVGLTADGLGLKRSLVAGLLILGFASSVGGWARDASTLLVLRAAEGFGFLLVSMPAPSLIRLLVPPQRMSVMLGIWGAYMPLGTAMALLCGPLVISLINWQTWWWGLGGLSFLMALWVWRILPSDSKRNANSAIQVGHSGSVCSPVVADAWPQRLRLTLKAPGPWLVALSFALYSGQWLAIIGFLPTIYAQAGFASGVIAILTALVAAVNIIGNIVSGRLLARGFPPQVLLYTGFGVMFLGTLLAFAVVPMEAGAEGLPPVIRFLSVLLFSMVGGMIPGTLFSLAVRLAPSENTVSTTVGWIQQWSSLGQFTGAPLVAWVASAVGGWHWTWVVTGTSSVLGIALAWQLGERSRR